MSFAPDILVTGRDHPDLALVVEVQSHLRDPAAIEEQLKRYMFGMQCPVGMIVTPEPLSLYRNTYIDYAPSSIERIGTFSMVGLLDVDHRTLAGSEARLAAAVQDWLERVASGADLTDLSPDLREAVDEHVLPALAQGEVRTAGPRRANATAAASTGD